MMTRSFSETKFATSNHLMPRPSPFKVRRSTSVGVHIAAQAAN